MKYKKNKPKKKFFDFNKIKSNFNFNLFSKYVIPLIFLLIAGIFIVLAQWAVLTKRGDSFTVGKPSPETYRVISQMRYDDQASANSLRSIINESITS